MWCTGMRVNRARVIVSVGILLAGMLTAVSLGVNSPMNSRAVAQDTAPLTVGQLCRDANPKRSGEVVSAYGLVINSVQGKGDASGMERVDFVSLFNPTLQPIQLSDYGVQLLDSDGVMLGGSAQLSGTLGPCQDAILFNATVNQPDAKNPTSWKNWPALSTNYDRTVGAVRLSMGEEPIDVVGIGNETQIFEYAPAPGGDLIYRTQATRDTDDNRADFSVANDGVFKDAEVTEDMLSVLPSGAVPNPNMCVVDGKYSSVEHLMIEEIYNGGSWGYIELYNPTGRPMNIDGIYLFMVPSDASSRQEGLGYRMQEGVIPPGGYFLLRVGEGDDKNLVMPNGDTIEADQVTGLPLVSTDGSYLLASKDVASDGEVSVADYQQIQDRVGIGDFKFAEGRNPASTIPEGKALSRAVLGADTDINGRDFTVGEPNPNNSKDGSNCDQFDSDGNVVAKPIKKEREKATPSVLNTEEQTADVTRMNFGNPLPPDAPRVSIRHIPSGGFFRFL